MKTKKESILLARKKYTAQFKKQVFGRVERDGVPKTAQDLAVVESLLYSWQAKSRQTGQSFEDQKNCSKQK